jgi:hypothetical protein
MTLTVPQYLKKSPFSDPSITYRWDDSDRWRHLDDPDGELVKTLEPLCHRANLALGIGMTEWLVRRFSTLSDDPLPWLIIEALWAKSVNLRYAEYVELKDAEWPGPIRGPMRTALENAQNILTACFDDDDTAEETASTSKLVLRVLPASEGFLKWRTGVIARLSQFYTQEKDDPVGPVVPREVLDLGVDFSPDLTNDLISRFLAGLDPATNGWLFNANYMNRLKFDGVPYRWDPDRDQDRFF